VTAGKLRTAVVGATGYSGLELTRLLLRHPHLEKPVLLRRQEGHDGAANLADVFPSLSGNGGYPLQPLSWPKLKSQGVELLFLATPHEASRSLVPEAMAEGMRVVDLSGAWRLKQAQHRAIYNFADENSMTAAELTAKAVYGLPELHADCIPDASLVANPGCYATSVILAVAPLLKAGLVDLEHGIIADSKSGVSGAGKEPTAKTHFVSVADNLSAYSVFGHRHVGEIAEQLGVDVRRPSKLIPASAAFTQGSRGFGFLQTPIFPRFNFRYIPITAISVFALPGTGGAWCSFPASTTCSKVPQDRQCRT